MSSGDMGMSCRPGVQSSDLDSEVVSCKSLTGSEDFPSTLGLRGFHESVI